MVRMIWILATKSARFWSLVLCLSASGSKSGDPYRRNWMLSVLVFWFPVIKMYACEFMNATKYVWHRDCLENVLLPSPTFHRSTTDTNSYPLPSRSKVFGPDYCAPKFCNKISSLKCSIIYKQATEMENVILTLLNFLCERVHKYTGFYSYPHSQRNLYLNPKSLTKLYRPIA